MSPGALHAGCSAGHMGSMDNATWLNMWMPRMWQRTLKRLVLEKWREWNLDVSIVRMCLSCDGLRSYFHSKETSSSYLNMFLQTRKPKKNHEGSYWSGIVWAIIPWLSWPILAIRLSFTVPRTATMLYPRIFGWRCREGQGASRYWRMSDQPSQLLASEYPQHRFDVVKDTSLYFNVYILVLILIPLIPFIPFTTLKNLSMKGVVQNVQKPKEIKPSKFLQVFQGPWSKLPPLRGLSGLPGVWPSFCTSVPSHVVLSAQIQLFLGSM